MYPISNTVKALYEAEQHQVLRITGTDKNGAAISITDADIVLNSFNIDRFSCIGSKLEIGTATAAEMTLKLDNRQGDYDNIVFEGTELYVEIGIADWTQTNPTVHWMPCGYFTPDEQPRTRDIITIHALDRMMRFDVVPPVMSPWVTQGGDYVTDSQGNIIYFLTNVQFPITVENLVKRVAMLCGVPFTQSLANFVNYSYTLTGLPNLQQQVTFRNLIQWCAGIMAANAFIDWNGELKFAWYDNSAVYNLTPANRFSSELSEDAITITGVQYTNTQGVTIVSGTADYALDMTGNYLLSNGAAQMMYYISGRVTALSSYRPFSASVLPAPFLWPMDTIRYIDADGNDSSCLVTNVNFGINGSTELEGKGETAQTNSGAAPLGMTTEQAYFIEKAAQATQDLDDSLTQEEIFNRLTDNGETQGLIMYNGKIYLNAEYIQAGTILANLLMGRTFTVGGGTNGDGKIRVLDSSGNEIGHWDKYGISITKGTINGPSMYLGGTSSTPGQLVVRDGNGSTIGLWNLNGITINKGTIAGPSITLGGSNNANGVLVVKDENGVTTCRLDNEGAVINGTLNSSYTDPDTSTTYRVQIKDGTITLYQSGTKSAEINWGLQGVGLYGNNVTLSAATANSSGELTGGSWVKAQSDGYIHITGGIYIRQAWNEASETRCSSGTITYVKDVVGGIPQMGHIYVVNGLITGWG